MNNMIKILPIFALCLGFVLGRFSANKISKEVVKTQTLQNTQVIAQVQTQGTDQKVSTEAKSAIIIKKHYSPKGKLRDITITKTNYATSNIQDSVYQVNTSQTVNQHFETTKTDLKSYESNWLIAFTIPVISKYPPSFKDFTLTGGYRVIGNLYVIASTDSFKTTSIGAAYTF